MTVTQTIEIKSRSYILNHLPDTVVFSGRIFVGYMADSNQPVIAFKNLGIDDQ